jgi:hypothetical protein
MPDDPDALMLAATARFEAGNPDGALAALNHARHVAPRPPDVLRGIGNITRALGDLDAAIGAFRHALSLDGDFAAVRHDLAELLMQRGNFAEAERELRAALEAVPTYADATLTLAALLRAERRGARRCSCWWSSSSAIRTASTAWWRSASCCWRWSGRRTRRWRSTACCASTPRTWGDLPPGAAARRAAAVARGAGELPPRRGAGARQRIRAARLPRGARGAAPPRGGRRRGPGSGHRRGGHRLMAIEGPLRELGIHDVFQLLDLSRKSGTLTVVSELRDNEGQVLFENGRIVSATIRSNPHRLGDLLVRSGRLTDADMAQARAAQGDGTGGSSARSSSRSGW